MSNATRVAPRCTKKYLKVLSSVCSHLFKIKTWWVGVLGFFFFLVCYKTWKAPLLPCSTRIEAVDPQTTSPLRGSHLLALGRSAALSPAVSAEPRRMLSHPPAPSARRAWRKPAGCPPGAAWGKESCQQVGRSNALPLGHLTAAVEEQKREPLFGVLCDLACSVLCCHSINRDFTTTTPDCSQAHLPPSLCIPSQPTHSPSPPSAFACFYISDFVDFISSDEQAAQKLHVRT